MSNYALVRILVLRFVIPYASTKVNSHAMKLYPTCSALFVRERSNFKNLLRTRKIVVMHSNERGEYPHRPKEEALEQRGCCSRTSSRPDRSSTETMTPPSSSTRSAR